VIEKALADLKIGQCAKVDDKWIRKLRQCIDGGGEYLS
jgi:hypothetical protein